LRLGGLGGSVDGDSELLGSWSEQVILLDHLSELDHDVVNPLHSDIDIILEDQDLLLQLAQSLVLHVLHEAVLLELIREWIILLGGGLVGWSGGLRLDPLGGGVDHLLRLGDQDAC
jgi:hypothetical protein